MEITPLTLLHASFAGFVLAIILSLTTFPRPRAWNYAVHATCATSSCLSLAAAAWALATGKTFVEEFRLLSIPLPKSVLRLDPLSAFMTLVISLVSTYVSMFAIGYVDHYFEKKGRLALLGANYAAFIASMILVALAGDAVLFLIAWEIMSVTSFFLVLTEHERKDVRRAASIYIVYATLSVVLIALGFGVGYLYTHTFVFTTWSSAAIPSAAASIMFALFFAGFAAKAGIVPLHSWLPQAHPAAPSHVSALLSGVMIKLAIYGLVRMLIILSPWASGWWAAALLGFGALTAFYGIAYALLQNDLKKLLAYSSIENVGIITLGIGCALAGASAHIPSLTLIGLLAALLHVLNHSLFKSQLFLCSGTILHQVNTRDLRLLGGLARVLKATTVAFLLGSLGITAMPFFNGFVSEWLTYNSLLQTIASATVSDDARFLAIVAFASLAATGVLALYTFVKAFGLAFLAPPRVRLSHVPKEPWAIKASYVIPSALIVLIGLYPSIIIAPLARGIATCIASAPSIVSSVVGGVALSVWSYPATYIPILVACFASVVGVVAWAKAISRARVSKLTTPFVSGVEFEEPMTVTAELYVGTARQLMKGFYGVDTEYSREYAVKLWTARAVKILRKPAEAYVGFLKRLGLSDEEIAEAVSNRDDFLQVVVHAIGAALVKKGSEIVSRIDRGIVSGFEAVARGVVAASRAVSRIDRGIVGGLAALAKGIARSASGVKRIQSGSVFAYLVYIYIALILILIYYVVVK